MWVAGDALSGPHLSPLPPTSLSSSLSPPLPVLSDSLTIPGGAEVILGPSSGGSGSQRLEAPRSGSQRLAAPRSAPGCHLSSTAVVLTRPSVQPEPEVIPARSIVCRTIQPRWSCQPGGEVCLRREELHRAHRKAGR